MPRVSLLSLFVLQLSAASNECLSKKLLERGALLPSASIVWTDFARRSILPGSVAKAPAVVPLSARRNTTVSAATIDGVSESSCRWKLPSRCRLLQYREEHRHHS